MPKSRDDINVREIMAAGEDVTRTILGKVLDAVSESAHERSAKWKDSDEAIRHLQNIRTAVNDGEELTWAVVDFWLAQLPPPDTYLLRTYVNDDEYDALTEQGKALGVTAEGFVTLLAQKSAKEHATQPTAEVTQLRSAVIVGATPQQVDQFLIANAEQFTGFRVTSRTPGNIAQVRGHTYEVGVVLTDIGSDVLNELGTTIRAGVVPTLVKVNPDQRFDLNAAIAQQRRANDEASLA